MMEELTADEHDIAARLASYHRKIRDLRRASLITEDLAADGLKTCASSCGHASTYAKQELLRPRAL